MVGESFQPRLAWKDEITAACISDNGRKIYLGDAKGRVVDLDKKGLLGTDYCSWSFPFESL